MESTRQKMVLCCGKSRGCPEVEELEGGAVVIRDPDQAGTPEIRLDPEQVRALAAWLAKPGP